MKLLPFNPSTPSNAQSFSPGPFGVQNNEIVDAEGASIATVVTSDPARRQADTRLLAASFELYRLLGQYVLTDRCRLDRDDTQADASGHEACRHCIGHNLLERIQGHMNEHVPVISFEALYVEQRFLRKHFEEQYSRFRGARNRAIEAIDDRIVRLRARQQKYQMVGHAEGIAACARAVAELGAIGALLRYHRSSVGDSSETFF